MVFTVNSDSYNIKFQLKLNIHNLTVPFILAKSIPHEQYLFVLERLISFLKPSSGFSHLVLPKSRVL